MRARVNLVDFDALSSWDIWWLKYENFKTENRDAIRCPQCMKTVTFQGVCVSLDELNYIMYGWCLTLDRGGNDVPLFMLSRGLYGRYLIPGSDSGDTPDSIERKVGFAKFGWGNGMGPSGPLPANLKWPHDCAAATGFILKPVITDWQWIPLRVHDAR